MSSRLWLYCQGKIPTLGWNFFENALLGITQVVPLAQALNVSTDALFGFAVENYDHKLANEVWFEATKLRDSGEPSQGALAAVEFLDQKCAENRALQVIRYSDEKELSEECHYAAEGLMRRPRSGRSFVKR